MRMKKVIKTNEKSVVRNFRITPLATAEECSVTALTTAEEFSVAQERHFSHRE
jgi:hypothetical protein